MLTAQWIISREDPQLDEFDIAVRCPTSIVGLDTALESLIASGHVEEEHDYYVATPMGIRSSLLGML